MALSNSIIVAIIVILLLVSVGLYFIFRTKDTFNTKTFDINTDPLTANPYNRKETDCGPSPKEIGGQYGLNPEYDNNITVKNFVNLYEKDTVFGQYKQDLAPTLLYNQTGYDIPARQICEVLYQGHQQYFENMWSGLGECELYQTEQAKKAKIKVATI